MLGTILLGKNLISKAQLDRALILQSRSGSRLGDILIGDGAISYFDLYRALAEHHKLPFVDLLKSPPDIHLLTGGIPPETFITHNVLPWKRNADGAILVAVTEYTEKTIAWCKQQFGETAQFVITSPLDIRRTVENHFGELLETASRLSLWQRAPHMSARVTVPPRQKQLFCVITLLLLALTAFYPLHLILAFIAFCHIAYGGTMFFKLLVFARGTLPNSKDDWQEKLDALDEKTLPVYTVLIPMYKEEESLPGMLEAMGNMDYPTSKLDIKLILEADDNQTYQAACKLRPRYHFDIIRVPPHPLRTKPKACNYALRYARGELVTVFDADDRPDRFQLKKAVIAFRENPPDVVCLQARLNYYNADDNILTRFFSLEYTILFHFMLYGLERLGIPIPLGGTSNHISLARIKELGEWDPYNVTEDADLGTRLSALGLKTRMLDSYTMEEAPNAVLPWLRQRSRWIKGYMQTWLVHMRSPKALYLALGNRGFIGFQFFIGFSCFTFLSAPIVWLLSLFWIADMVQWHHITFPLWLMWLTGINFFVNILTHWYLSSYCALLYRKNRPRMLVAALLFPFYMVLHSIASYKALWQLAVKPHFWEKTMHGLAYEADNGRAEQDIAKSRVPA